MAASCFEVMSFASKFLHLGTCGINATLQFEALNGRVVANFTADLGPLMPPPSFPPTQSMQNKSSPSRLRRRKRRAKIQSNLMVYDENASSTINHEVDDADSSLNYLGVNDIEGEPFVDTQDKAPEETVFDATECLNNETEDDRTGVLEFLGDSAVFDKTMCDNANMNMVQFSTGDLKLNPTTSNPQNFDQPSDVLSKKDFHQYMDHFISSLEKELSKLS